MPQPSKRWRTESEHRRSPTTLPVSSKYSAAQDRCRFSSCTALVETSSVSKNWRASWVAIRRCMAYKRAASLVIIRRTPASRRWPHTTSTWSGRFSLTGLMPSPAFPSAESSPSKWHVESRPVVRELPCWHCWTQLRWGRTDCCPRSTHLRKASALLARRIRFHAGNLWRLSPATRRSITSSKRHVRCEGEREAGLWQVRFRLYLGTGPGDRVRRASDCTA